MYCTTLWVKNFPDKYLTLFGSDVKIVVTLNINLILEIISLSWLIVLTVFFVWLFTVLKNLIKDAKNDGFIKAFKDIKQIQSNNTKEILTLNKNLASFIEESRIHIQKVGLVKFNPFNESGGDHSFSLALLDGLKNGIIITSLHARERTRLYIKEVLSGKSKLELSKEEEKALSSALK